MKQNSKQTTTNNLYLYRNVHLLLFNKLNEREFQSMFILGLTRLTKVNNAATDIDFVFRFFFRFIQWKSRSKFPFQRLCCISFSFRQRKINRQKFLVSPRIPFKIHKKQRMHFIEKQPIDMLFEQTYIF